MNLLNRIISYDINKIENQEKCNCIECVSVENTEMTNRIDEYPKLSEEEIKQIINEKYFNKDEKTKEFIINFLRKHGDLYDLSETLYIKKRIKLTIICKKHGYVTKYPTNFLNADTICDLCKLDKIVKNFIKNSKLKYGENSIDYSKMNYINSKTEIDLICNIHNIVFRVKPNTHLTSCKGCHLCGKESYKKSRSKTLEQFLIEISKIPKCKDYDFSESIYDGHDNLMKVKCKKHGYFTITPHRLLDGQGCRFCGIESSAKTRTDTKENFLQKCKEIYGDSYNYSKIEYFDKNTEISIICNTCGKIFMKKPKLHLSGQGCTYCAKIKSTENRKITFSEFVEKSNATHIKGRYIYFESEYDDYLSDTKIKCTYCNKIFTQNARQHSRGSNCTNCHQFNNELKISKWLELNNINFEKQKKFEDCKYKKELLFDFYLPRHNLCIEFDGEQHFKKVNWTGKMMEEQMEENLKSNQLRDQIKNEFCKNNGINLLRIRYDENIEEKLTEYFKILNNT